jgi:hypothetical protein
MWYNSVSKIKGVITMSDSKKFLIVSLVTSIIYIILGLVFMFINKLDTISVILFTLIVLVAAISSMLCWKIMYKINRGQN